MMTQQYAQYKKMSVETASPETLLIMLYDGLIKFLNQTKVCMELKNIEETNKNVGKAQAIITELMVTLNMDYPISNNLYSLYDFYNRRLTEANIKKDITILDDIIVTFIDLRQTWAEAAKQVKNQQFNNNSSVV